MNKLYLFPLGVASIAIPSYFDILYGIELWSILIIPAFLIILYFPRWSVGIGTILLLTVVELAATEIAEFDPLTTHQIHYRFLDPLKNSLVLLTLTYYRIKGRKTVQRLEELSVSDPLTGVYNRRYLDNTLKKLAEAHTPFLLIMLDIDYFKKVNDTYGHLCGDELLKWMTKLIRRHIRGSDTIVRLGGEEFALVFPETDLEQGIDMAERIRQLFEHEVFHYDNSPVQITISLGVAASNNGGFADLADKADQALYRSKRNGRNQVSIA